MGNGFVDAFVDAIAGGNTILCNQTIYTEPVSNALRSIVSTSSSDSSSGVGARVVRIHYYSRLTPASAMTGPFFVDVALNGTTAVNLGSGTELQYVDRMEVLGVGSNNANVGDISLMTGTFGAGSVIGSIKAGFNKTYWGHKYVGGTTPLKVHSLHVSANYGGTNITRFSLRVRTLNSPTITVTNMLIRNVQCLGSQPTLTLEFPQPLEVSPEALIEAAVYNTVSTQQIYSIGYAYSQA